MSFIGNENLLHFSHSCQCHYLDIAIVPTKGMRGQSPFNLKFVFMSNECPLKCQLKTKQRNAKKESMKS